MFPEEILLDVCGDESINDGFFSIIDVENSCGGNFIDYDVKNICNLDDSLCEMLSLPSSSQDGFGEDSQYGVIGDMGQYLDTPFIKHSGRFYSFVTRFSLERIHARIADLYPAKAVAEEDSSDECIDENTEEEDVEDVAEDDDSKDIVSEEEVLDTYEDESEEYDEPLEEFFPLVAGDPEPSCEDEEGEASSKEESGAETQQGEYTALVGDDAYSYLDDVPPEEFESDPLLDEQDSLYEEDDDGDESVAEDEALQDQTDPYSEKSLFDVCDDDDPETSEEQNDVPEEEPCVENEATSEEEAVVEDECSPAEEVVIEEDSSEDAPCPAEETIASEQEEPEPVEPEEEEPKAEPTPVHEYIQESASHGSDSILDQVLKSFAKSNPVVQYVEQCTEGQRDELAGVMEKALAACREDGKDKMFAIPDTTISVCIFRTTRDPMLEIQRRENVGALMFAGGHDTWNSLELYVNELGSLVKCEYRKVTRFSFSDWEWKIVEKLGQRILDRRGM